MVKAWSTASENIYLLAETLHWSFISLKGIRQNSIYLFQCFSVKSLTCLRKLQHYLMNQKIPGTVSYGGLSLNLSSNSKFFLFCTGRKPIKLWTFQCSYMFLITREADTLFNSRSLVSSSLHSQYMCCVFQCLEECCVFHCSDWAAITLPLSYQGCLWIQVYAKCQVGWITPSNFGSCISGLETPFCSEHLPLKRAPHPCLPAVLDCCCHFAIAVYAVFKAASEIFARLWHYIYCLMEMYNANI